MNAAFERKLTVALAATCGLLMLLTLTMRFGLLSADLPDAVGAKPLEIELLRPLRESKSTLPPIEAYSEISDRPLFNNTRTPIAINTAPVDDKKPTPSTPLNATLAGVVRSKGADVALLIDKATSKPVRLRVGQPMPGDQGEWVVKEISAREVVFDGGSQGDTVVKLDPSAAPATAAPPPPPPRSPTAPPPGQPANPNVAGQAPPPSQPMSADPNQNVPPGQAPQTQNTAQMDPAAREAEIRRIIEERRAQMRAEAEKAGNQ